MTPLSVALSIVISSLWPAVLEALKRQRWAFFIQPYAPVLNRLTAIVVALATALGVGATFDAATGTLTITGLLPEAMLQALANLLVQQLVYRRLIDPGAPRR